MEGQLNKLNRGPVSNPLTMLSDFESYFKVGVSDDYILLRDDFPMESIAPGEFSKLCIEMFRQNDEARHGK